VKNGHQVIAGAKKVLIGAIGPANEDAV